MAEDQKTARALRAAGERLLQIGEKAAKEAKAIQDTRSKDHPMAASLTGASLVLMALAEAADVAAASFADQ